MPSLAMILSSLASIAERRASTPLSTPFVAAEDGAARWGMAGAAAARGMTGGGDDAAFGSGFFHDGAAAGAGAGFGFGFGCITAASEQKEEDGVSFRHIE